MSRFTGRNGARLLLLAFLAWTTVLLAGDYIFRGGDTLYALAQTHYGDASYWPALKQFNGIVNHYKIANGTPIVLPDKAVLDQVRGIMSEASIPAGDKAGRIAALNPNGPPARAQVPVNEGTGKSHSYDAILGLTQSNLPTAN